MAVPKTNILFVVNSLKPRGAEQQLYMFVKALPGNINVHIYSFSQDKNEYPELANLCRVLIFTDSRNKHYVIRPILLFMHIRRHHYDVIATLGLGSALLFGRLTGILHNIGIIYSFLNTYHNFNVLPRAKNKYFDYLNSILNVLIVKSRGKKIHRFIPNSKTLEQKINQEAIGYQTKTLYNGYEFAMIDNANAVKHVKYDAITNESKRKFTIIQAGELDKNKNPIFTVEVFSEFIKLVPSSILIFIGDGSETNRTKEIIKKYGLEKSVFFTGRVSRETCLAIMSKANLLILTSKSESFPNVLIEAQLMQVPVISLDVGAAGEIIEDSINGFLVKNGNKEMFVSCLARLENDSQLAKTMGRNGRQLVMDKFSMQKKMMEFISMLSRDIEIIDDEHLISES